MKYAFIIFLLAFLKMAAEEIRSTGSAFGGAIVSPKEADLAKIELKPKDVHRQPTEEELKNFVIGIWQDSSTKLQITSDKKFIFIEAQSGQPESTWKGTWDIKNQKIIYSIDYRNAPLLQNESYSHEILRSAEDHLTLQNPFGLVFEFKKTEK
jgi:hypothetical protein